jgi:chemotaxis protein CheX
MGLSGAASGSVVISLPSKLAIEIVGAMLGDDMGNTLTPEVGDGVGEIINMIAGQAKASLTKTKYHFQISIPTVVMGQGHEITHRQGTPNIVVLFTTEAGDDFAIQVCLSPEGEGTEHAQ